MTSLFPGHGPGQWSIDYTTTPPVVTIHCPRCGDPQRCSEHTVDRAGVMSPAVACRHCFWNATVRLLEWNDAGEEIAQKREGEADAAKE